MKQTYKFKKYQGNIGWFLLEIQFTSPIQIKHLELTGGSPTLETEETTGGEGGYALRRSLPQNFVTSPPRLATQPAMRWHWKHRKPRQPVLWGSPYPRTAVTYHCSYSKPLCSHQQGLWGSLTFKITPFIFFCLGICTQLLRSFRNHISLIYHCHIKLISDLPPNTHNSITMLVCSPQNRTF